MAESSEIPEWELVANRYSEDMADGALENVEGLYRTIPSYRAGWSSIHPQDQQDWLGNFNAVRHPLASLASWEGQGLLSQFQRRRYQDLLQLIDQYAPLLAELDGRGLVFPLPGAVVPDEFDLW